MENINLKLAETILKENNLNPREDFYQGRNVNKIDITGDILFKMFGMLFKKDVNYAIEFIKMIKEMRVLRAREFIKTFKNFANNNFTFDSTLIEHSNVTFGNGNNEDFQSAVAFISNFLQNQSPSQHVDWDEFNSSFIKIDFIELIDKATPELNISSIYGEEEYNELMRKNDKKTI